MEFRACPPWAAGAGGTSMTEGGVSCMTTKTKIRLKPLGDRVIVKVLDTEDGKKTPGGIYVPDTAKEKPQEAEVMAVGNGKYIEEKLVPLDVKVGDRIVFGKYSGAEVTVDDEEYLILKESDISSSIKGGDNHVKADYFWRGSTSRTARR